MFGTILEEQVYILIDTSLSMKDKLSLLKEKLFQLMQVRLCLSIATGVTVAKNNLVLIFFLSCSHLFVPFHYTSGVCCDDLYFGSRFEESLCAPKCRSFCVDLVKKIRSLTKKLNRRRMLMCAVLG